MDPFTTLLADAMMGAAEPCPNEHLHPGTLGCWCATYAAAARDECPTSGLLVIPERIT